MSSLSPGSLWLSWTHVSNAPKQSPGHSVALNICVVPKTWLLEAYSLSNHHCCLEALYFHGQYDQNKVPSWLLGASWHFGRMPHQKQPVPAMGRRFPTAREGEPWQPQLWANKRLLPLLRCSGVCFVRKIASHLGWNLPPLMPWKNAAAECKRWQTVGTAEPAALGLSPPIVDGHLPSTGSSVGAECGSQQNPARGAPLSCTCRDPIRVISVCPAWVFAKWQTLPLITPPVIREHFVQFCLGGWHRCYCTEPWSWR